MPMGNNGVFIRTVFWMLLIGSFGWATSLGIMNATALNGHCKESQAKLDGIRDEVVIRDEVMLKEITREFKEINMGMAEQRADIKWIKARILSATND